MRYFRDSSGRIRTEYSLSALGPFALQQVEKVIVISDWVTGQQFLLHPALKRADALHITKNSASQLSLQPFALRATDGSGRPEGPGLLAPGAALDCLDGQQAGERNSTTALGQRRIEGSKAIGTRSERTIAAGEMGNELPITISTETWVSEDLDVVLYSRQHDPLIGDTTFRLQQIQRSEPDPALFQVPPDYTVKPLEVPVFVQPRATGPAAAAR
jgi:hypothetical protein